MRFGHDLFRLVEKLVFIQSPEIYFRGYLRWSYLTFYVVLIGECFIETLFGTTLLNSFLALTLE